MASLVVVCFVNIPISIEQDVRMITLQLTFGDDAYFDVRLDQKEKINGTENVMTCATLCLESPRCVAINLSPEFADGTRLCELLDVLCATRSSWMETRPGYSYATVGMYKLSLKIVATLVSLLERKEID